jgi:hypothetical protein
MKNLSVADLLKWLRSAPAQQEDLDFADEIEATAEGLLYEQAEQPRGRECLSDGIEHRVGGLGPEARAGAEAPVDRRDDPTGEDVAADAFGAWEYLRRG